MTFDFTPAFYTAACIGTPSQERLAAKCAELRSAARALEGRMNCIAEPSSDACKELIVAAQKAKSDDMPKYNKCIAVGQQTYNQGRAMAERRSNNCAYELHGTGGPNSKGTSWRKLLPGACRKGTFVGRDGLDCCSGVLLADGPLGLECRLFYPPKASN